MRPSPLPRTKHVNQVLVIARKDAKPKFLAWANVTLIPGLAAGFAFLMSWSFVFEYSFISGLPLEPYFGVIDYVQLTPRWSYIFIPLCVVVVGVSAWLKFLYFTYPAFASVVAKAVRPRTGQIMAFVVVPLLAFSLLMLLTFRMGKSEAQSRKHLPVSAIFLKKQNAFLKGKLLFQLSRYVLILADDKYLIAIPQTEVEMIQTPSRLLQVGDKPSPTSAPPVTSSTSPEAK